MGFRILYFSKYIFRVSLRSGDSKFFEDQSQIEKDLREIQKIELKQKLNEMKEIRHATTNSNNFRHDQ